MSTKVLMVDSDWNFSRKAEKFFSSRGDLMVRETVENVISHASRWQPDLIILAAEYASVGMLQTLRLLQPRPIILITEHMSRYDRAWEAWQNGGDELLMKPVFHNEDFRQAVITATENAVVDPYWVNRQKAVSA